MLGDGHHEGLEGLPGVPVARQGAQHRQADLLREVVHEVAGVSREPRQPRPAVAQGERVDAGEEIVSGLFVPLDRALDEGTDLSLAVGRGRRLVVAHRSMVHPSRAIRRTASVVVR
ncbi:hypothetical protein GCM10010405_39280 [Streptomyces macrosporus]|uniref:Uncharacterized protein n=1 Tax=Streptomyces macrosporus TaxID=44032 RepID=A0ABN3KAN7_9ACTN